MRRPAQGIDRATFDERFSQIRDRLVSACRPIVGDEAEDAVQETYLRARSRLGQLRDPNLLAPWLMRIAINQCYAQRRRGSKLSDLLARIFARSSAAESDPDLRSLIAGLTGRERTVLVLHYGHGLSLVEIAGLLGINESTVRGIAFRSRRSLATQLKETSPSEARR